MTAITLGASLHIKYLQARNGLNRGLNTLLETTSSAIHYVVDGIYKFITNRIVSALNKMDDRQDNLYDIRKREIARVRVEYTNRNQRLEQILANTDKDLASDEDKINAATAIK